MKHPLRRADRAIPNADAMALLAHGEYGVMATCDTDGTPYAIPISYALRHGAIYFHSARIGHKAENLAHDPRVCFTVVGEVRAVYDGNFTTLYESAVAFGEVSEVTDVVEKHEALMALVLKYLPGRADQAPHSIERAVDQTAVYRLDIERVTGKANRGRPSAPAAD